MIGASTPIAWTPSVLREALAARVRTIDGLVEARTTPGVVGAPAQVAARCFSIRFGEDEGEGPQRSHTDIRRTFFVDLLHVAGPTGPKAWDQALDDEARVRLALLSSRDDALRRVEHRIFYRRGPEPTIEGGAYRRRSLRFEITTAECIEEA